MSPAYARFVQELACYRADEPYLAAEKCALRCCFLSTLIAAHPWASLHPLIRSGRVVPP